MKKYSFALAIAGIVTLAAVAVLLGFDPTASHSLAVYTAEAGGAVTLTDFKALTDKLAEVTAKFNTKSDEMSKQAEAAMAEVKDKGAMLDATKAQVDTLLIQHTELSKEKNKLTTELAETQARLTGVEQELVRKAGPSGTSAHKTVGQRMIEDEKFKAYASAMVSARSKEGFRFGVKAAITSTDFPVTEPSIVQPTYVPGTFPRLAQRLFVRDLMDVGQTDAPAIFWVKQTGFTNNADVVTESTLKPTSTITYDGVMSPVSTIAHLFKASRQILAEFKQLRTDVDREMRYGVKYAEEQEILLGNGQGQHLLGIVPQSTAYSAAFTPELPNRVDTIRLAILQSQIARLPATGIVMHFTDHARVDLTKDSNGNYLFSNPLRALGVSQLWGLPVVPTEIGSFQGHFLVGAFRGAAQIYDREEINVEIATENNDDFEKNMVTIRCEERVGLAVFRPEAFIYGTFQATT